MNLLLIAAAGSLCLAVAMWIALVAARWLRHRASVRRRAARVTAGLAIAEFCGDGNVDALSRKLARLPADDVIAVTGRALPALARRDREAVGSALAGCGISGRVRRSLKRPDESKRVLHCELMAVIGDDDALAVLRAALRDRAATVRIAAAIALVQVGEPLPLGELLTRLGRAARESSRLVLLLEKLVPDCETEIIDLVTNHRAEPRLRVSALQALELAGAPAHGALLVRLAQDPSAPVAAAATSGLAREGGARSASVLISMLTHPAPEVRRQAAAALGGSGFTAALPALLRLTGDSHPPVAAAAARSAWLLRRQDHHLKAAPSGVAAAGGWR